MNKRIWVPLVTAGFVVGGGAVMTASAAPAKPVAPAKAAPAAAPVAAQTQVTTTTTSTLTLDPFTLQPDFNPLTPVGNVDDENHKSNPPGHNKPPKSKKKPPKPPKPKNPNHPHPAP